MWHYIRSGILLLGVSIVLTACGGSPPPEREMIAAQATIRGAQEVGANNLPRSSLYLKLAERQVEKAKALVADGYNDRAALVLKRAQADADLALSTAREESAIAEARKMTEALAELKKQLKQ
jgi:high-affinity K+ transport system ATPase subunit B